jgi:hypothetical protein
LKRNKNENSQKSNPKDWPVISHFCQFTGYFLQHCKSPSRFSAGSMLMDFTAVSVRFSFLAQYMAIYCQTRIQTTKYSSVRGRFQMKYGIIKET